MGLLCQVCLYKMSTDLIISCRFDHPSNKEANKVLIQGVMAVNKDDKVTPSTVKRKA